MAAVATLIVVVIGVTVAVGIGIGRVDREWVPAFALGIGLIGWSAIAAQAIAHAHRQ
jgi:hypothetical protein